MHVGHIIPLYTDHLRDSGPTWVQSFPPPPLHGAIDGGMVSDLPPPFLHEQCKTHLADTLVLGDNQLSPNLA